MKPDAETETSIAAALEAYFEAYSRRDLSAVLSAVLPDPEMVNYGTGLDEKYIGYEGVKAGIQRDFAQSEGAALKLDWYHISAAGPVAWVAGDIAFHAKVNGQEMVLPVRYTAVLLKKDGKWLFAHQHYSEAATGQETGQSWRPV